MTEPHRQAFQTTGRAWQDASISADGLHLPELRDSVLDVFFDDQRVWSIAPSRDAVGDDRLHLTPWPPALHGYLDGTTRVRVRDHVTGETRVDEEFRFGSRMGRVRVADADGRPLTVNKWGRLERPFDSGDPRVVEDLLERTSQVLEILSQECQLAAFITYGTLLGAVREGQLIAHDNDADVAYLSAHSHPADVIRESFHIQRVLLRHGWRVVRSSAGFLQLIFKGPDGSPRNLDVFTCFCVEDCFYQEFHVRAALPRSAIVPVREVALRGRRFPAPADPEALLEATYGLGWRVPDPSFRFETPREARRRLGGWFGGYKVHRRYWEDFYSSDQSDTVVEKPSPFAQWVKERETTSMPLVDIGSGAGRDALYFARHGYHVLGLDYARSAIVRARAAARSESLPASFEVLNFYDLRQVLTRGARLAASGRPHTLYGRFLLHALGDGGREHMWRLAEMALRAGGRLYLEFRTSKDAGAEHVFGEHFRRFLDPDVVVDEIEARGGHIDYREEGHGMAPFQDEDPHVCRLVVGWQR